MEQSELSQSSFFNRELDNSETEEAVEFLLEIKVPCLICGVATEINNIIKREVTECNEDSDENECVHATDNTNHTIFHGFLKWFDVTIKKKGKQSTIDRGWDGEGGDILRFCCNCKMELMEYLDLQKQLDDLEKKIKDRKEELKRKMERCEEAFQSNGIYDHDKRYKIVRRQIVKNENSENHFQDKLGSSLGKPDMRNGRKRCPKTKSDASTSVYSTITNDIEPLKFKGSTVVLSTLDKTAQCQLTSIVSDKDPDILCNISDSVKETRAGVGNKMAKKLASTQRKAKIVNNLVQKKEALRTSSRIKEKGVPEKQSLPKRSQVSKNPVHKKVRSLNSSKTDKPANSDDEQGNTSSLSLENNQNDQPSNSKSCLIDKWNYKLNPVTNIITFEGSKFSTSTELQDNVACCLCKVVLTNDNAVMRDHIVNKHNKGFACTQCSYRCNQNNRLKLHILTVHGGILEKCPKCGKKYAHLKHHMKQQHGSIPRLKCTERGCRKTFKRMTNLKEHVNAAHTKLKLWKCKECGRDFAWKASFEAHVNMHYGITPFKCEVGRCEAAFSRKSSLNKHRSCYHRHGRKT